MSSDIVIKIDGLWKRYGLPIPDVFGKVRSLLRTSIPADKHERPREHQCGDRGGGCGVMNHCNAGNWLEQGYERVPDDAVHPWHSAE